MIVSTIIATIGLLLVVFKIDPVSTGAFGYLLFYFTLFFAAAGILSLLIFVFNWIFSKNAPIFPIITKSLRRGLLLAILIVSFLLLQQFNVFTWWSMTLIFTAVIIIEFFFISHKPGRKF